MTTRRIRIVLIIAAGLAVLGGILYLASQATVAVLDPAGTIARQQRDLILYATALSLIVIVPVFVMTAVIAWRYRASNHRATYQPEFAGSRWAETVWWLIPSLLIGILAVVAWRTSHSLDPTVAIASSKDTVHIQAVALNWKWLFIYPEQGIATVNHVELPVGRPVRFDITSDGPMNSFWIPQLGGQIYAMAGMSTQLNLMADKAGSFRGSSANISGTGFADMGFTAKAVDESSYQTWLNDTDASTASLTSSAFAALAKPGTSRVRHFGSVEPRLYDAIVHKYSHHGVAGDSL
jgi:cytochrome o ubiquinol oxidase subunit 2